MRVILPVLALVFTVVTGNDVKMRLRTRPPAMPNFNPTLWMGQWFIQYWFAPCSWQGSSQMTDQTLLNIHAGKGVIKEQVTWRANGQCTSVKETMFPTKAPGVYKLVDNIGNVLSGDIQIVATDYNCFSISQGCTRPSAMGTMCEDPWLSVKTRMPKPDPKCLQKVDQVLANILQLRLGDLLRIPHGRSCLAPLSPPKKGLF